MIHDIINEQITVIIKRISLYTIVLYAVGFLAYNFYITTMIGNAFDIINIQYLYTGIMCILPFFIPLSILSLKYKNRTDDISKTYLMTPEILCITLMFGVLTIFPLILLSDGLDMNSLLASEMINKVGSKIVLLFFLVQIIMSSSASHNIKIKTRATIYLILYIIQVSFLLIFSGPIVRIYSVLLLCISYTYYVYLGLIADKEADLRIFVTTIISIMIIISIYSTKVLPNISERFGGFLYRPISIVIKPEYIQSYKEIGFSIHKDKIINNLNLKLDSNLFYIVKLKNEYVKINKDTILLTKRNIK